MDNKNTDQSITDQPITGHRINAIKIMDSIRDKYNEFLANRKSRYDDEWGAWSHTMNRELRKFCEMQDSEYSLRYKYVFLYWSNISNLLELYHKFPHKISKTKKKKEYVDLLNAFRQVIMAWDISKVQDPGNFEKLSALTAAIKKAPAKKFKSKKK